MTTADGNKMVKSIGAKVPKGLFYDELFMGRYDCHWYCLCRFYGEFGSGDGCGNPIGAGCRYSVYYYDGRYVYVGRIDGDCQRGRACRLSVAINRTGIAYAFSGGAAKEQGGRIYFP